MTKNVATIGAGVMGHNIATEFAMYGHNVTIYDVSEDARKAVMDRIDKDLQFMVDDGFIDAERKAFTLTHLKVCDTLEEAGKDADFVVEAVAEKEEIKSTLFADLDKICKPETIFMTNTSSLTLDSIVKKLPIERKQKTLVAHYFNPANVIPCIELSLFGDTTQETYDAAEALYKSVEKHPIHVYKDVDGMVGNRLQLCLYREVAYLLDQGVCGVKDIDECLSFGPALRYTAIGHLGGWDMNSVSLTRHVADNIWPHLCNDADTNGGILEQMDKEGKDGIKSGEGFYKYPAECQEAIRENNTKKLLALCKITKGFKSVDDIVAEKSSK